MVNFFKRQVNVYDARAKKQARLLAYAFKSFKP